MKQMADAAETLRGVGREPEAILLSPDAWDALHSELERTRLIGPRVGALDGGVVNGLPIFQNLEPGAPPIQVRPKPRADGLIEVRLKKDGRQVAPFVARATGGIINPDFRTRGLTPLVYPHQCAYDFNDDPGFEIKTVGRHYGKPMIVCDEAEPIDDAVWDKIRARMGKTDISKTYALWRNLLGQK